jgi:hypothetical protein
VEEPEGMNSVVPFLQVEKFVQLAVELAAEVESD